MTGRAHKVLEEALSLSEDECLDLAERLLSSLPADPEWLAELERRARRALADPSGGEAAGGGVYALVPWEVQPLGTNVAAAAALRWSRAARRRCDAHLRQR